MEDKVQILYDAASSVYDLGTIDEFRTKLQDPEKRKLFYDAASTEFDLGDYPEFESKVVKKKDISSIKDATQPSMEGISEGFGNRLKDLQSEQSPLESNKDTNPEKQRTTSKIGDLGRSLKAGTLRTLGGLAGIPQLVNNSISELVFKPAIKALSLDDEESAMALETLEKTRPRLVDSTTAIGGEASQVKLNKIAADTEEKMYQIQGDIKENLIKGEDGKRDVGAAIELLGRGVAQSIPYLAITAATAGAGTPAVLGSIGATAASQQYGETVGNEKLTEPKRVLNAWMYGGFEAAGELVTAGLMRGAGGMMSGKVLEGLSAKKIGTELLKGFFEESSSEIATQVGQNFTDIITGADPNRGLFDGWLDAGLIGGVTGAGIPTVGIAGNIVGRMVATPEEVEKVRDNTKQQEVIIEQIKSTDNETVKSTLEGQLNNLVDESTEIMNDNVDVARKLSPQQAERVVELYTTVNDIQGKIDSKEIAEEDVETMQGVVDEALSEIESIKEAAMEVEMEGQQDVPVYSMGEESITREDAIKAIEEAESIDDIEGLVVSNDAEVEAMIADKFKESPKGETETFTVPQKEGEPLVFNSKEE